MGVKICINYTDGEVVDRQFDSLLECLEYLKTEIVKKNEFVDEINIKTT